MIKKQEGRVEESRFPQEHGADLDTGAQILLTIHRISLILQGVSLAKSDLLFSSLSSKGKGERCLQVLEVGEKVAEQRPG